MRYGKRTSPVHEVRPGRMDTPLCWPHLSDQELCEMIETRWMTEEERAEYMVWELAWSVEAARMRKGRT
jgi:hypothetical protein